MQTVKVRLTKQTWAGRCDPEGAAPVRVSLVFRNALMQLLRINGVCAQWLASLNFSLNHESPHKGIHYTPHVEAALIGEYPQPQWGIDVYLPLALQVYVTQIDESHTHVIFMLHIAESCAEYLVRMLATQPREHTSTSDIAEPTVPDDLSTTGSGRRLNFE